MAGQGGAGEGGRRGRGYPGGAIPLSSLPLRYGGLRTHCWRQTDRLDNDGDRDRAARGRTTESAGEEGTQGRLHHIRVPLTNDRSLAVKGDAARALHDGVIAAMIGERRDPTQTGGFNVLR